MRIEKTLEELKERSIALNLDPALWTSLWEDQLICSPICVLDLETTGLRPGVDQIVEISVIKLCPNLFQQGKVEYWHSLVQPLHSPLANYGTAIHGIDHSMLQDAPLLSSLLPSLKQFLQGCSLIGHQLRFDLSFLLYDLNNNDSSDDDHHHFALSSHFFDTLEASKKIQRQWNNLWNPSGHRLELLAKEVGFSGNFHRAQQDTLATLAVMNHFLHLGQEQSSIATVIKWMTLPWTQKSTPEDAHASEQMNTVSSNQSCNFEIQLLHYSLRERFPLWMSYRGGSMGTTWRPLQPLLLFPSSNPKQLLAHCLVSGERKYFLLSKIIDLRKDPP